MQPRQRIGFSCYSTWMREGFDVRFDIEHVDAMRARSPLRTQRIAVRECPDANRLRVAGIRVSKHATDLENAHARRFTTDVRVQRFEKAWQQRRAHHIHL